MKKLYLFVLLSVLFLPQNYDAQAQPDFPIRLAYYTFFDRELFLIQDGEPILVSPSLVEQEGFGFSWSPDCNQFMFTESSGTFEWHVTIYDVETNTHSETWLNLHIVELLWSPLGNQVIFTERINALSVVSIADIDSLDTPTVIFRASDFGDAHASIVDWSDDGSTFVLFSHNGRSGLQFHVIDLTTIPYSIRTSDNIVALSGLDLSSDGRQLIFSHRPTEERDIFLLDTTTWEYTNLTNNPSSYNSMEWSPTDDRIAYNNGTGIYVMDADGSNIVNIVPENTLIDFVSVRGWSYDGEYIIYTQDTDYQGFFISKLYATSADSLNNIELGITDRETPESIEWLPCMP